MTQMLPPLRHDEAQREKTRKQLAFTASRVALAAVKNLVSTWQVSPAFPDLNHVEIESREERLHQCSFLMTNAFSSP